MAPLFLSPVHGYGHLKFFVGYAQLPAQQYMDEVLRNEGFILQFTAHSLRLTLSW